MRIVTSLQEARDLLLHRDPTRVQMTPGLQQKLFQVFQRDLTAEEAVAEVIAEVRQRGDAAIVDLARRFDGVELGRLEVSRQEIAQAYGKVDTDVIDALHLAAERIRAFHQRQVPQGWLDLSEGLGQAIRPIERVGFYVPGGGAAYPSTVLMSAIPARVAGVREIIVATPGRERGEVPPATLVACDIAKVDRVFRIGGPQAIAALAFGTESVPRVDKICGPGNPLVQIAKRSVFGVVGIDTIQGPTETIVIADESADPAYCSADLLAQAEHADDANPILLTTSERLAQRVFRQVRQDARGYPDTSSIHHSIEVNGVIVVLSSFEEIVGLTNAFAPEHLCLLVSDPWAVVGRFRNAGGIFLGQGSPEVLGDYIAGPSHVMPTAGAARFASPLNVLDFVKITSIVGMPEEAVRRIGPAAARIGHAEGLTAHARAIEVRLERAAEEETPSDEDILEEL